jgi:hypothetical protein
MTETANTIQAITELCTVEFVTYHPQSFLGYNQETGKLVHVVGLTTNGNWLSDRGFLYRPEAITEDLTQFAHHQQLLARDEAETLADALV